MNADRSGRVQKKSVNEITRFVKQGKIFLYVIREDFSIMRSPENFCAHHQTVMFLRTNTHFYSL